MDNNNSDPRLEDQTVLDQTDQDDSTAKEDQADQGDTKTKKLVSALYDYAEIFAVSIIAVILLFSFCIRLCRVDGSSMNQTLQHGELVVAENLFYTPKQGDIVVFHLVNDAFHRPLVKRVIATEGQTVEINFTDKIITVDGVAYDDENAYIQGGEYQIKYDFDTKKIHRSNGKLYFKATVPEGKLFVLGDNRNNSTDSRSIHVGFVDSDCVLGKAVVRLDPFTVFD